MGVEGDGEGERTHNELSHDATFICSLVTLFTFLFTGPWIL